MEDAIVRGRLWIVRASPAIASVAGQPIEQATTRYGILLDIVRRAEKYLDLLSRLGIQPADGVIERVDLVPTLRQIGLLQIRQQFDEQRNPAKLRRCREFELI